MSVTKKFKKKDLEELFFEESSSSGLVFVETSSWKDDGKYSFKTLIFKCGAGYYSYTVSRSGSYHTEYFYSFEYEPSEIECYKVEKVTKTIEVWEKV